MSRSRSSALVDEAAATAVGRQDAACLACGARELSIVETLAVADVADKWSEELALRQGAPVDVRARRDEFVRSVGSEYLRFDRCGRCGLQMSSPRRPWDDGSYPEDQPYPVRWEFERFLDDLGPTKARVLELGCGAGAFLGMAVERGHEAVGIDFNPVGVEAARARGLQAVHGGFDSLEQFLDAERRNEPFDAVAMFQVIEHLADPAALLHALDPFVRRGTRLAVSCPGPRRYTRLMRETQLGTSDFWDYPPHHVLRWTLPALDEFFSANGWRVVESLEEPLSLVGASSEIACSRAIWNGYIGNPFLRRLGILWARARLLSSRRRWGGMSIYMLAERT